MTLPTTRLAEIAEREEFDRFIDKMFDEGCAAYTKAIYFEIWKAAWSAQLTAAQERERMDAELMARVIEPYAWALRDKLLRPFEENRGSMGEEPHQLYALAFQAGCRNAVEAGQWFDKNAGHDALLIKQSREKAEKIVQLTPDCLVTKVRERADQLGGAG